MFLRQTESPVNFYLYLHSAQENVHPIPQVLMKSEFSLSCEKNTFVPQNKESCPWILAFHIKF